MTENNKEGFVKRAQHTMENGLNLAIRSKSAIHVKKQKLDSLEQENNDLLERNIDLMTEKANQGEKIVSLEALIASKDAEQEKQAASFAEEKAELLAKIASLEEKLTDLAGKNEELKQEHTDEKARFENNIATLTEQNEQVQKSLSQTQDMLDDLKRENECVKAELESEKQMRVELQEKFDLEHAQVLSLEAAFMKVKNELAEEKKITGKLSKQVEESKAGVNVDELLKNAYSVLTQGRYDDAIELYQKAINFEKTGRNSSLNLGSLWYSVYFCHFKSDRFDEALEALSNSIRYRSDVPSNLYLRAKMYQEMGRRSEAIADVIKVLELKPDFCQAKDLLNELKYSR